MTWVEFPRVLTNQFDVHLKESPFERFTAIAQMGMAEEYSNLFVQMASQGLSEKVRGSIRLMQPPNLKTAMDLARDVESNLVIVGGGQGWRARSSTFTRPVFYSRPTSGQSFPSGPRPSVPHLVGSTGSHGPRPHREFSQCGHQCPIWQLNILMEEEDEALDLHCFEFHGDLDRQERETTIVVPEEEEKEEVTVLIDSSASHNFISSTVVVELDLKPDESSRFWVQLGDGRRLDSLGICRNIGLSMAGLKLKADFYDFPLGRVDFILGVAWLAKLREVKKNWAKLTISFVFKGSRVHLGGDSALCRGPIGVRALVRMEEAEFLVTVVLGPPLGVSEPAEEAIVEVLSQFEKVFGEPEGLPPIAVQKDEIEQMVVDMLLAGIIQPSSSPFSSPVLLVTMKMELLDELSGAVIFSKIDLRSGYHKIRVEDRGIYKMAFRTYTGHYEFLVLSWQHHKEHLREELQVFQDNQYKRNQKKCSFGCSKLEYLGHVISTARVEMDPEKIRTVVEWPGPRSFFDVRGFLGLTGYYRRFVQWYGQIALRLTHLLKKNASVPFAWTEVAEGPFQALKSALTTAPVLAKPDFQKQFVIECDVSGSGIGAVRTQEGHPITYFSKSLAEKTLAQSAYEREIMGLVLAVQHWRPYLVGRQFTVRTNHSKDALSRKGNERVLLALSSTDWGELADVLSEEARDGFVQSIVTDLRRNPSSRLGFETVDGKLFYMGRIVLASDSVWILKLLQESYDTPLGDHAGVLRTYRFECLLERHVPGSAGLRGKTLDLPEGKI
ncbi:uncharacterized protein LOC127249174 [Andrographis paniculata]|uniref:uncharacterized protein LOC127249174 n=1 Tax=Andrographis paniculata TaxID=175694 RepID=UPI0021E82B01|nr:uncharacterized protein LOC127249174 [Andrographis paniculata]